MGIVLKHVLCSEFHLRFITKEEPTDGSFWGTEKQTWQGSCVAVNFLEGLLRPLSNLLKWHRQAERWSDTVIRNLPKEGECE